MRPIPSLIPRFNLDYGFKDFCYGIRSIFSGDEFDLEPLESIFGKRTFLFTNYGRSSLYIILRALNLPKGSKIGVPLYSCTVVFDAIVNAGLVPCFVDIDLNNYTVDPGDLEEKIEDLSAVVVIHTFGRPADMDKINEIANGIPVIEDCAHSLMSGYKGRITGTLGDASFFSLAKYISAGGGGMIILNDNNIVKEIESEVKNLKRYSILNEIKHCIVAYMRSFLYHKPWFGLFALPIGLAIEDKVDLMDKKSFEIAAINRNDLSVFIKKISSFGMKVEAQRKNSFLLMEELKDTPLILPYERKDTYCNYYLFPIRFEKGRERDSVSDFLRKRGVDTSKLYSETPLKAKQCYGYKGDCPNTEKCGSTLLTIPNHYTLKKNDLLKIAESVKEAIYENHS